jgi:hypothetical protein
MFYGNTYSRNMQRVSNVFCRMESKKMADIQSLLFFFFGGHVPNQNGGSKHVMAVG